ncbi:diguanylate cyclase [Shewanella chilikensis]|uniref:diguanylate cyclase n=1 Tax=Shewanella chilikensis TaxID=558541 RepID=A0A6G7LVW6_9GAMM|nr:diguanylate cyclase [Shewanella chilikensis]QIJ05901.1 diguanylate cyclase [Shewanella chilikensis]
MLRFLRPILFGSLLLATAAVNAVTIPYCVDPDWMPYEGIDQGKHVGISSGFLELIEEQTDWQFQLVPTDSWQQTLAYLKQQRCVFTTMLNYTPRRAEFLYFSDIYSRSPNVLVSRREQPFLQNMEQVGDRSLAIPRGYRLLDYVRQNYPKIRIILAETEQQGLEMVSSGEADLFIGSMYSINARIQQSGLFNLKIAAWAGPEEQFRMAVTENSKWMLPELNRLLAQISDDYRARLYRQWSNIAVLKQTDRGLTWQLLVVVTLVFGALLARYRWISKYNRELTAKNQQLEKLRNQLLETNRELEFISTHDPLTKLYNRHYFHRHFAPEHRSDAMQGHTSLIVIDIDFFKDINDRHGHSVGDSILSDLASLLMEGAREIDLVARWGGEEFMIVCPDTDCVQARHLCERLASAMTVYPFYAGVRLSCSFGLTELKPGESIWSAFDRADQALYRAKSEGRNRICCDPEYDRANKIGPNSSV